MLSNVFNRVVRALGNANKARQYTKQISRKLTYLPEKIYNSLVYGPKKVYKGIDNTIITCQYQTIPQHKDKLELELGFQEIFIFLQ